MSVLDLCYWVRGQPFDYCEDIQIPPETKVSKLAYQIIERHGLPSTTKVAIYKVPDERKVFDNDSMGDSLGALSISSLGPSLRRMQMLSSCFVPPIISGQVHFVVDGLLSIRCWCSGADVASSFKVTADRGADVDDLKRVIKDTEPALSGISLSILRLYKVPPSTTDEELDELLNTTGDLPQLPGKRLLEEVFNDVPFSKFPGIVIGKLSEKVDKSPPPVNLPNVDQLEDTVFAVRSEFLTSSQKEKPSSSGTPSSFRTRQEGQRFIPCGRPRDSKRNQEEIIPSTLLCSVFGQFVDDCQSIDTTVDDNVLAYELSIAMSKLYSSEANRVIGVNEVLGQHGIHLNISKIQKTNYSVDGDMSVNGHRYVIAEFKNEAGNTSAEPYFEAIAYYLESTRETALKHLRSPLPCLLLIIFGPYIVFTGATWNLRPAAQVLSMPIAFHFHSTDIQSHLAVARHMAAFRKATKDLEAYYRDLRPLPRPVTPATQIFPHPTTYTPRPDPEAEGVCPNRKIEGAAEESGRKTFRYEREVAQKKLIFFATDEDGKKICVKFTRTYSAEAHDHLASLECAPKLRGLERIAGGWLMAIFDALVGFETLSDHKSLPLTVFDDMSEKLASFHKAGFVHGDVRDVNIMVSKMDPTKFMFVDFDWSGKAGEVRYPPLVNTTTISRPPGAKGGEPIKAEHDDFMFDRIRSAGVRE